MRVQEVQRKNYKAELSRDLSHFPGPRTDLPFEGA